MKQNRGMKNLQKASYLAHSESGQYEAMLKGFDRFSRDMMDECDNPYISMSFGKDSLVMTHRLLTLYPHLPVYYVNCGQFDEWPDTQRVKNSFLRQFPCDFHEIEAPSIIEYYRRLGYVYIQDEEDNSQAKSIQRRYGKSLEVAILDYANKNGLNGQFLGLRKQESSIRGMVVKKYGEVYFAKTRQMWTCLPLSQWSARDIWAYIVKHKIDYNELYDIHPQGRELARNGAMIGSRNSNYFGRFGFLRQMYPNIYNRLVAEFPEVERWL